MKSLFAALMLLALTFSAAPARAEAMEWTMLKEDSSMTFEQAGNSLPVFAFGAEVNFDPSNLGGSRIVIDADLSTAFTPPEYLTDDVAAAQRESARMGAVPDSKNSAGAARFVSRQIRRDSGNIFIMSGNLTANGRSEPMEIPFTVDIGETLVISGEFDIDPEKFAGDKLSAPGTGNIPVSFEFHEVPAQ